MPESFSVAGIKRKEISVCISRDGESAIRGQHSCTRSFRSKFVSSNEFCPV